MVIVTKTSSGLTKNNFGLMICKTSATVPKNKKRNIGIYFLFHNLFIFLTEQYKIMIIHSIANAYAKLTPFPYE